jgi:hypothetical protein
MKTTAITTQQLAGLADLSPSFFTLHRDDLPEAFDVPSASPKGGRPAKGYSLEQIAEFILDRTSFLSDAECRLRVALMPNVRNQERADMKLPCNIRMIDDAAGNHVLFDQPAELSPELRAKFQTLRLEEHDTLRARRCAKRQTRPIATDPQESQP